MSGDETPKFGRDVLPTLRASQGGEGVLVIDPTAPRERAVSRLTVLERERAQGFPDGHTMPRLILGEEANQFDTARKRALGNTFAVPVVRWIGERIKLYEEIMDGQAR